jgi:hypothetical protein
MNFTAKYDSIDLELKKPASLLASFPGPKALAISRWLVTLELSGVCTYLKVLDNHRYEFYYEVIKGGRFGDEIKKFHEQFGE